MNIRSNQNGGQFGSTYGYAQQQCDLSELYLKVLPLRMIIEIENRLENNMLNVKFLKQKSDLSGLRNE